MYACVCVSVLCLYGHCVIMYLCVYACVFVYAYVCAFVCVMVWMFVVHVCVLGTSPASLGTPAQEGL